MGLNLWEWLIISLAIGIMVCGAMWVKSSDSYIENRIRSLEKPTKHIENREIIWIPIRIS